MENIILCMLLTKSMTIYELKIYIEQALNTVCSSSLGSIQAALKKLLQNNRIAIREYESKGVLKKEYYILQDGVDQFLEWMQTPIKWYKAKNMEEGKFFYLGLLPKEKRLVMLEQLICDLKTEQQSFIQLSDYLESTKEDMVKNNTEQMQQNSELVEKLLSVSESDSLEKTITNIYTYQLYLLEYGLQTVQNDITFFTSILEREKSGDKK